MRNVVNVRFVRYVMFGRFVSFVRVFASVILGVWGRVRAGSALSASAHTRDNSGCARVRTHYVVPHIAVCTTYRSNDIDT